MLLMCQGRQGLRALSLVRNRFVVAPKLKQSAHFCFLPFAFDREGRRCRHRRWPSEVLLRRLSKLPSCKFIVRKITSYHIRTVL